MNLDDPVAAAMPPVAGRPPPKILFLVTEDWYFCSHRLPVARAARDAGFAVTVACRVAAHGEAIRAEGFALRPLAWRRRGDGLSGGLRAIAAIARLYRQERPDILHHVALKPVIFGSLARRLAFPAGHAPAVVAAVMGLGSGFTAGGLAARLLRPLLARALALCAGGSRVIVQNADDRAALQRLGLRAEQISLIRGSGVDTDWFTPLPEPPGAVLTVALIGRMLRQKGICAATAAVRRLRARGHPIELLLAGPVDLGNRGSLTEAEMAALTREPGVGWLGAVADVREVWRRAAIAVLPSTYGEGVPKALIEAAACARPLIAADVPGCREIVRPGLSGILVPPRDRDGLAQAILDLAGNPARRRVLGTGARALVEAEFTEAAVARETLALYRGLLLRSGRQ